MHDCMVNIAIQPSYIPSNTLDTGGNSVELKGLKRLFELNRVTNQGLLQHDGAAIQVDYDRTDERSCKNWIHDHMQLFVTRFDSPWLDTTLELMELFEKCNLECVQLCPKEMPTTFTTTLALITIRSISQFFRSKSW